MISSSNPASSCNGHNFSVVKSYFKQNLILSIKSYFKHKILFKHKSYFKHFLILSIKSYLNINLILNKVSVSFTSLE